MIIMLYESFEFKNSKYQGNAGMGAAIAYYSQAGYDVSLPMTDSTYYDLIVDDGERLYKVQCKTTSHKSKYGVYSVTLSTKGGNQSFNTIKKFDANLLDFLFVLTSDGRWYNIPTHAITATVELNLGKDKDQYLVNGTINREYIEYTRKVVPREPKPEKQPKEQSLVKRIRAKKIDWPPTEELLQRVEEKGYSAVGRELGVSDNAVRKHLRTHTSHTSK